MTKCDSSGLTFQLPPGKVSDAMKARYDFELNLKRLEALETLKVLESLGNAPRLRRLTSILGDAGETPSSPEISEG